MQMKEDRLQSFGGKIQGAGVGVLLPQLGLASAQIARVEKTRLQ